MSMRTMRLAANRLSSKKVVYCVTVPTLSHQHYGTRSGVASVYSLDEQGASTTASYRSLQVQVPRQLH